jgi:sensor histidine kinase YesM
MRLQVNQHMLLNFLNTVYSLSRMGKNDEVSDFTQLLMKYFRYVLRQNIALVPIREEMQFVNDYLKLQRVRFRDCFVSVYQMDEEAKDVLIPQLLLQNFVENSIKYGLVMGSEIEILINIRREGEKVCISICDTGNGMERGVVEKLQEGEIVEDKNGKHVGIWNCLRRLRYYYGEHFNFRITSEIGGGTQIWMELPSEPLKTEDNVQTVRRLERERFLKGGRT